MSVLALDFPGCRDSLADWVKKCQKCCWFMDLDSNMTTIFCVQRGQKKLYMRLD